MAIDETRMQQLRATAAQWSANNPVLLDGEIGFISDTGSMKIGDGSTSFNALPTVGGASTNFLIEWQTGADVVSSVSTITQFTYTSNALVVMVNGIIQENGVDYNETGSNTVTWVEDPVTDDDITFFQYEVVDTGIDAPALSENNYEGYVRTLGPILWYKMSEQTGSVMGDNQGNRDGIYSSSAEINNLGVNNIVSSNRAVWYQDGDASKSTVTFDFDDTSSPIDVIMEQIYGVKTSFSISFWCSYYGNAVEQEDIFNSGSGRYLKAYRSTGSVIKDNIAFSIRTGELVYEGRGREFFNKKLISTKPYFMLTATFEKINGTSGKLNLYLNGTISDSKNLTYTEVSYGGAEYLYLAGNPSVGNTAFDGAITDFQIYDRKLEAEEVLSKYYYSTNNALPTPPTITPTTYDTALLAASPVLWYRMDEANGNVMVDYQDNRHGVYDEMTGVVYQDTGVGSGVSENKSLNFSASSTGNASATFDFAKTSGIDKQIKDMAMMSSDFSLSFWVARESSTGSGVEENIIQLNTNQTTGSPWWYICFSGSSKKLTFTGLVPQAQVSGELIPANGVFYFVTVTFRDLGATATSKIYINGVERATNTTSKSTPTDYKPVANLQVIGGLNANVSVTSFAVFDSLLSPATILDLYNKGIA